jgi:hypothetical protein
VLAVALCRGCEPGSSSRGNGRRWPAAKLDQPQAAEVIASSQARVSRMESGHAAPRGIGVRLLLDAYGVTGAEVRVKLEEWAKHPEKRGW